MIKKRVVKFLRMMFDREDDRARTQPAYDAMFNAPVETVVAALKHMGERVEQKSFQRDMSLIKLGISVGVAVSVAAALPEQWEVLNVLMKSVEEEIK